MSALFFDALNDGGFSFSALTPINYKGADEKPNEGLIWDFLKII